jgi:hypothetical protein
MYCLKLLHVSKFEIAQRQMNRKLKGRSFYAPPYCAEYGFSQPPGDRYGNVNKGYRRGSMAIIDGVRWVRCYYCAELKKGDDAMNKCHGACNACRECFDKRGCRFGKRTWAKNRLWYRDGSRLA